MRNHPSVDRAMRACRSRYADGGAPKSWYDTISEYTQPIRDFSDRTGNTDFWREVVSNPGLALAAQFVGRAPVRGTPAYDQAMMRVLDRRAGGPAQTHYSDIGPRHRSTPEQSRSFPPIRDGYENRSNVIAEQRGMRFAGTPQQPLISGHRMITDPTWLHEAKTSMPANQRQPFRANERAGLDYDLRRRQFQVMD